MGIPSAGQVVLVPFPFSDPANAKLRPAVVLAQAGSGNWILCQLTSNPYGDARAVPLSAHDFSKGGLRVHVFARPGKLFTASQNLIAKKVGQLSKPATAALLQAVAGIFLEG